ncbi:hypothetical protein HK104_004522 [Borealophlyctis nickersoniae]|nr:hypothetical protein HK104_004522 [Borealophlyctis nickersoniae]
MATPSNTTPAVSPALPLSKVLPIELGSALISGAMVAPAVTIIDRAIFASASGSQPLRTGLLTGVKSLLSNPTAFIKQPAFLLMYCVYSGTYATANTTLALCDHYSRPSFYPKFIATSVVNTLLSVGKDLYFTRAFGSGVPRRVPPASYLLYTSRDALTIFASFNMPALLSSRLVQAPWGISKPVGDVMAQLITPCAVQLLSTPIHLTGIDLYNRPHASIRDRVAFVKREYPGATVARMGRIFAAFGMGGVTNTWLRERGRKWVEENAVVEGTERKGLGLLMEVVDRRAAMMRQLCSGESSDITLVDI